MIRPDYSDRFRPRPPPRLTVADIVGALLFTLFICWVK